MCAAGEEARDGVTCRFSEVSIPTKTYKLRDTNQKQTGTVSMR
jgi:hypothetical protein